jgi:hypothetical protein
MLQGHFQNLELGCGGKLVIDLLSTDGVVDQIASPNSAPFPVAAHTGSGHSLGLVFLCPIILGLTLWLASDRVTRCKS